MWYIVGYWYPWLRELTHSKRVQEKYGHLKKEEEKEEERLDKFENPMIVVCISNNWVFV